VGCAGALRTVSRSTSAPQFCRVVPCLVSHGPKKLFPGPVSSTQRTPSKPDALTPLIVDAGLQAMQRRLHASRQQRARHRFAGFLRCRSPRTVGLAYSTIPRRRSTCVVQTRPSPFCEERPAWSPQQREKHGELRPLDRRSSPLFPRLRRLLAPPSNTAPPYASSLDCTAAL
jgi:hypothetical protein